MRSLMCLAFALSVVGTGCAGVHPMQSDVDAPPGSLHLGVVFDLAPRAEVLKHEDFLRMLNSAGIADEDIADGSVISTKIHCCEGFDDLTYGMAFAPRGVQLQRGDIVEIRTAFGPEDAGLKRLNVVTRVREPHDAKPPRCKWIPDEPGMWMRTLYCDWMPAEGWVEIKSWGLPRVWVKEAAEAPP